VDTFPVLLGPRSGGWAGGGGGDGGGAGRRPGEYDMGGVGEKWGATGGSGGGGGRGGVGLRGRWLGGVVVGAARVRRNEWWTGKGVRGEGGGGSGGGGGWGEGGWGG